MAIKTREGLKSIFVNGAIPTDKDFRDLIDSALIRRDDCFFGKWQAGTTYYHGDVVLYKKSLYLLVLGENNEECEPEEKEENKENTGSDLPKNICSVDPPEEDKRWCLLELQIEDDDWEIIINEEDGDQSVMVAKVFGRIGMGTDNPEARLDIRKGPGQFLFDPDNEKDPVITILKHGENDKTKLSSSVGKEYATWRTDAPLGYVFKKKSSQNDPSQKETTEEELLLMLITADNENRPKVGIGTDYPEAMVEVKDGENGRFLISPDKEDPEIVLIKLTPQGEKNSFFSSSIKTNYAAFTTDAQEGFRFIKGNGPQKNKEQTLFTIDGEGHVGIGTDTPRANVEIMDRSSGAFLLSTKNHNPVISILNLRPRSNAKENYLAIGIDNHRSVLVSDASQGFVFKKGYEYGENGNEENINQGDSLMYVTNDKKVGIGSHPGEYELNVSGNVNACAYYISSNENNVDKKGTLEKTNVLDKLKAIVPVKFTWKKGTFPSCEGQTNIGLLAYEVEESFPELVMHDDEGTQTGVAYANMVAVLVQAVKDQQSIIEDLTKRVEKLEKSKGK